MHRHGPASGTVLVYTLYHERDTAKRDKCATACPVERGRVALAVTRSEKVGAPGGEGLSQAA